jgi:hypothetical protein
MARTHDTSRPAGDFTLHLGGDDNSTKWPRDAIAVALLADIRRELRESNKLQAQNGAALMRVRDELRQLNRRLKVAGFTTKKGNPNAA